MDMNINKMARQEDNFFLQQSKGWNFWSCLQKSDHPNKNPKTIQNSLFNDFTYI